MTMILYGRDLSPFARRVAIWCELQDRPAERRKLMVSGPEWEEIKKVSPQGRVPILTDEAGKPMIETWAIIDWLEDTAPDGKRLIPRTGEARREVMQRMAFASSTAEKGVTLVSEKNRRDEALRVAAVIERLEGQITAGLEAIEAMTPDSGWVGGEKPDGSDVTFVVVHDFIKSTNPHLLEPGYPRLAALAGMAAGVEAFAASDPSNVPV